jgi:hypothetical protein
MRMARFEMHIRTRLHINIVRYEKTKQGGIMSMYRCGRPCAQTLHLQNSIIINWFQGRSERTNHVALFYGQLCALYIKKSPISIYLLHSVLARPVVIPDLQRPPRNYLV